MGGDLLEAFGTGMNGIVSVVGRISCDAVGFVVEIFTSPANSRDRPSSPNAAAGTGDEAGEADCELGPA